MSDERGGARAPISQEVADRTEASFVVIKELWNALMAAAVIALEHDIDDDTVKGILGVTSKHAREARSAARSAHERDPRLQ
jgi:hypothetical protein